jgi:hypothetical protein
MAGGITVTLTFDAHEWNDFLEAWQEPAVKKTLKAGAASFGRAAKPILKAATPEGPIGNKYGDAGNLRRTVRYKQIRARYGIGVVVAPMSGKGKSAFYRRFVVGGTKPHLILPKSLGGRLAIVGGWAEAVHHPGATPHPFVARAAAAMEHAGFAAAEHTILDGLEAKRVQGEEEG